MFGRNERVGANYFDCADDTDKLMVTSVFYTLQGEGPYSGMPAVFVRLSKCQLSCSFCDTYFDHGEWYTFPALSDLIDATISTWFKEDVPPWLEKSYRFGALDFERRKAVLVITGGEPTLQKNLGPFTNFMMQSFEYIQVETNGILLRDLPIHVYAVVSPKCAEKNGKAVVYLRPHLKMLERADCLKFVISADKDTPYHTIPLWALDWRDRTGNEIFISPMNIYQREPAMAKELAWGGKPDLKGRSEAERISFWEPGLLSLEQNQRNHEYAAEYCLRNGLRLSLQSHLYASLP